MTESHKLSVAERYQWYILNALMFTIKNKQKAVDEAKATWDAASEEERQSVLYVSLENLIEHLDQQIKEHQEALDALKLVGFV